MTDTRWRQTARITGYGAAAAGAGTLAVAAVLAGQASLARRVIPRAEAPPPRGSGLYGARSGGEPITVAVLGDSSAAGYGVDRPRETPGALLATGISRRTRRPVRLYSLAVVGAASAQLWPQVEAALEVGPDLAVILIGGNDVTRRASQSAAVRYLVQAVRALRGAGAQVVVGTCPDLGTILPIQPPLRWLARRWSRQLAAAQTVAVVEAGGWTVSLGDLLGPRFAAEPHRMFGRDQFHPSVEGYAAAAAALLPTTLAALGVGEAVTPAQVTGVRALPVAAEEAARHSGTEVSGVTVAGRERGPAGRWASLHRRVRQAIRPAEPALTAESDPIAGPSPTPAADPAVGGSTDGDAGGGAPGDHTDVGGPAAARSPTTPRKSTMESR